MVLESTDNHTSCQISLRGVLVKSFKVFLPTLIFKE